MKTINIHTVLLSSALVLVASFAQASSISGLTSFSPDTTAKSSEVNGNFTAVENAVNDNDSRITSLESNPSISGNLTLPESTASAGNIMKGSVRFLNNYGTDNVFLGEYAGNFSLTGSMNTGNGVQALNYLSTGSANTAMGAYVLSADTTGQDNTGTGAEALYNNTSGNNNTAEGFVALNNNAIGSDNTAIGNHTLYVSTGNNNTATGSWALYVNSTGHDNSASGYYALYSNTTGNYNTAFGSGAMNSSATGSENIALGYNAGQNLDTGSYNIDIGNDGIAGDANTIRLGDSNQTSTYIAGINGTNLTAGTAVYVDSNGQLGTTLSSRRFKDHIRPMGKASDVLNELHPVTFYYRSDHDPKGRHLQYGLVAEDVAKVAPTLVAYGKNGKPDGVYYRFLAPMLLNQYQKQQQLIQAQGMLLKKQAQEIVALKKQAAQVAVLQKQMARINTILAAREQPQRVAEAGMR